MKPAVDGIYASQARLPVSYAVKILRAVLDLFLCLDSSLIEDLQLRQIGAVQ